MKFKIDTKEKFTVVTPLEPNLSATLAAQIAETANSCLSTTPKNVILKLAELTTIEDDAANSLAHLQQQFYESNASFVICEVNPSVEETLEKLELLEYMNITPTESEAWDIVQMEEIERELLDSDDI